MGQPTPRTATGDTEHRIRETARRLLIEQGSGAVTLRAIAREIGITAPALYRYYSSHEELVHRIGQDICQDLAQDLRAHVDALEETDTVQRFLEVCRRFRLWALSHPREYVLVFASVENRQTDEQVDRSFGSVLMATAGEVLVSKSVTLPDDDSVPESLRAGLREFRAWVVTGFAEQGVSVGEEMISLGLAHFMLQFWTRLYGHVTLEVFNSFPDSMPVTEAFFESMLAELIGVVGLGS